MVTGFVVNGTIMIMDYGVGPEWRPVFPGQED